MKLKKDGWPVTAKARIAPIAATVRAVAVFIGRISAAAEHDQRLVIGRRAGSEHVDYTLDCGRGRARPERRALTEHRAQATVIVEQPAEGSAFRYPVGDAEQHIARRQAHAVSYEGDLV
jgi:hypothetical protein